MTDEKKNPEELEDESPQENQVHEPDAGDKKSRTEKKAEKKAAKELEELKKKLEQAEAALAKKSDQLLRTAAEYDNFRKRSEREKASIYPDATAAAVLEFLPVADNLERALAQEECSAEDLRKGVEMVYSQLKKALEKLKITEVGAPGEPFDPELHNAVSHIEDESMGENTIAEVFQKGYCLEDKVVRHAMVVVAN